MASMARKISMHLDLERELRFALVSEFLHLKDSTKEQNLIDSVLADPLARDSIVSADCEAT